MSGRQRKAGGGWYRIVNAADGPAQIMIYDEIGFFGVSAQDFIHELGQVNGPVEVRVNSPGGDVFDAYAIYNALASRPGVTTVVDSLAASAASVIVMAGEQRLMARTSQMMIHDAWAMSDGGAQDLRHMADRLDMVSGQIADVYAAAAGGDAAAWRDLMRAETWFTPAQALEAGLITGMTGTGREPAPAAPPAAAAREPGLIMATVISSDLPLYDDRTRSYQDAEVMPRVRKWASKDGSGDVSSLDWHKFARAFLWHEAATPANDQDGDGLPDQVGAYRLKIGDVINGELYAVWRGVTVIAGVMQGSRGGTTIPDSDRAGVKTQVEKYYAKARSLFKDDSIKVPWDSAAASAAGREENAVDDDVLTIEGRRSRVGEIRARRQEIAAAYPASVLPEGSQAEWDQLDAELRDHVAALAAVEARNAALAGDLAATGAAGVADRPQARQAGPQPPQRGSGMPNPAFHPAHDIWDIAAIRQRAHNTDELPGLYRDYAMRAIERGRFPNRMISRETAQANVVKVMDSVTDDRDGALARRILRTGNPDYVRAFGRAMASGGPGALAGRDAQILALGLDDGGAYAVPYELDATVILTSSGAVNPLRQISRVERIVGKEYDLVASTGVTVTRGAERRVTPDATPTLTQPKVTAEKVDGFIVFTVELEGDWTALQGQMSELVRDAKDIEEATSFVTGDGTAPNAGGCVGSLAAASDVTGTGGVATLGIDDPTTLEDAMAPRFRAQASYLACKTTFNAYRKLFGAQAGYATDPWNRPSMGQPAELWGYGAYEASAMAATHATGDKPLLMGDFRRGFLIVDRIGMSMELVPHVFDATTQRPTGQRGYYVFWRNNSVILADNAFRVLVVG